jgi:hypothetical protein
MSSWSLLLALSGFHYDGPRHVLRLAPRHQAGDFKCFFSAPEGWGIFQRANRQAPTTEIIVQFGQLRLETLELAEVRGENPSNLVVKLAGRQIPFTSSISGGLRRIDFKPKGITLKAEQKLEVVPAS